MYICSARIYRQIFAAGLEQAGFDRRKQQSQA
jgi:hypothetical protein